MGAINWEASGEDPEMGPFLEEPIHGGLGPKAPVRSSCHVLPRWRELQGGRGHPAPKDGLELQRDRDRNVICSRPRGHLHPDGQARLSKP